MRVSKRGKHLAKGGSHYHVGHTGNFGKRAMSNIDSNLNGKKWVLTVVSKNNDPVEKKKKWEMK